VSGSTQGAGGVGGLLGCEEMSGTHAGDYVFAFDGNGNAGQVIDGSGSIAAAYEYDAFGRTAASSGSYKDANVYRFSTKHVDVESDLYYYGYRFYSAGLGRWTNRDPIGEEGGINLYGFVENRSLGSIDYMGLYLSINEAIQTLFLINGDYLTTALLQHYSDGSGTPVVLTYGVVTDLGINPPIDIFNHREGTDAVFAAVKEQRCVSFEDSVSLYFATEAGNNALGNFFVILKGEVCPCEKSWTFEGEFLLFDRFDFDPKPDSWLKSKFGGGEHSRSDAGELKTAIASIVLWGEPFDILSEWIPVKQKGGESGGTW
jgi:RHS repeat-associated protein